MASDHGEGPVVEQRLPDVGARLREARERHGRTLYAIAEVTKISVATLRAIERNDLDRLPGRLYTRGHVRAYAAELGLKADELAAEYVSQFPAPPGEPPVPDGEAVDRPPVPMRALIVAVLVCGIGLLAYGAFGRSSGEVGPGPSAADGAPTGDVMRTPVTGASPAAPATSNTPVMVLEVLPDAACWVSVRADGRVAVFRVMQRGERELIEANDSLVVNVGDAGAFVYRINGAAGRPLGRPGDVVTVRITGDTYRTFLAAAADPDGR